MKTYEQNVQTLLSRQDLAKRWGLTPQAVINYEQQGILTRNPNIPTPRYNLYEVERIENMGVGENITGNSITPKTYKIDTFKEKPDQKTANEYFASGKYFWNSGMFGFTSQFLKSELKKCEPEVSQAFECVSTGKAPELSKIHDIFYISQWQEMEEAYKKTPKIAIDNAIAEKTKNAYAVSTSFNWDDVGSWDAFSKFAEGNENVIAKAESENCFVYSDIPVAFLGYMSLFVAGKNSKRAAN